MGKINEFQRKQLASSVTGTPQQSTAGQIIGKSVSALGDALTKRQDALDTAEATKTYYQYVAADTIGAAKLQSNYLSDPTLDPLTFGEIYTEQSNIRAQTFKDKLPNRIHNKFDTLVQRQQAVQSIKNTKWVMDLQNRNALEGFQALGSEFNIIAGQATNADDFMTAVKAYEEGSLAFKAVTTAASYKSTQKTHRRNMAVNHISSRMDIDNGGNPLSLWKDLSSNTEYRQALSDSLGESSLQGMERKLDKAIMAMGVDRGFKKLMVDDANLIDLSDKVFTQDNGYGLSDLENLHQMESNFLISMKSNNVKGVNDKYIEQSEKNLKVYGDLIEIARYTNDVSYPTDPVAKAELIAEINNVLIPFKDTKIKEEIRGVRKDIGKQQQTGEVRVSFGGFLTGSTIRNLLTRAALETITGVPKSIRAERGEDVKATQSMTEYMQGMYEVKGKILVARRAKKITSQDAQILIAKFTGPLSTFNSYDTVQNKGRNWFTEGFNSFNDYVRSMDLRGIAEVNRVVRDTIQAQMMTRLSEQVASLGIEPTDAFVIGAINSIKNAMNIRRYRAFAGAKPGDSVLFNGRPVEFMGFDPYSGEPLTKTAEGLQSAVDNT